VAIYRVEKTPDKSPGVRLLPVLVGPTGSKQCRIVRSGLPMQGGKAALFVYALSRPERVSCPPSMA
jgi:hypothetical protein